MGKNIIVTDMNGNTIGSTYPKRAKGLIKSGRAELKEENIICLKEMKEYDLSSCPPHTDRLEDHMNTYNITGQVEEDVKVVVHDTVETEDGFVSIYEKSAKQLVLSCI